MLTFATTGGPLAHRLGRSIAGASVQQSVCARTRWHGRFQARRSRADSLASVRMALTAAVGVNDQEDDVMSTEWAIIEAVRKFDDENPEGNKPELAIVHVTSDRDIGVVLSEVRTRLGENVRVVGATSCNGVLHPAGAIQGGMSIMLLGGTDDAFRTGVGSFADGDACDVSERVAASLGDDITAAFLMPTPGAEEAVLRGVKKALGEKVAIFGGSAADNTVSGEWHVFEGQVAHSSGVAMLGIRGNRGVKVGTSLCGPYVTTPTTATVTKASGRTLHTLNEKPAADVLYGQVGEAIKEAYDNGGDVLGAMSVRPYALQRNGTHIPVHIASIEQPSGAVSLFAEAEVGDVLVRMARVGDDPDAAAHVAAGDAIRTAYTKACESGGIETPVATFMVYCGGVAMAVGEDGLERNCVLDLQQIESLPWHATVGVTAFGEQGNGQHANLSVGMLVLQ